MIADFRNEARLGFGIIVHLEVLPRPPKMILGNLGAVGIGHRIHIGGAGQVGAEVVVLEQHVRKHLTGQLIPVGIPPGRLQNVGLIAFVVARPHQQGGMLPQLFDYADSLLAQRLLHGFILGINGTGHGKILPYQYPFFIADVKELFILIDIAAPAAHRIAADLVHHIQHRRNPLGITGMQRIRRHPVGTQDKDRFAVHAEIELPFGIFSAGRMVDEIHRPQSRPEGAGVHRLSAVLQRYRHIIHRLFAAALGPPEMHLCDLAVQLTGVEPGGIAHGKAAVAAASLAADGVIPKLTLVVLEGIIQRDISPSVFQIDVLRHEIGFLDMGLRAVFQLDRPPQAARKNTGRNVPAEHVRCLADIEGRSVIFHGDGAQGRPVLLRLQQGGADMYDNIGFAVRKPFHRNPCEESAYCRIHKPADR